MFFELPYYQSSWVEKLNVEFAVEESPWMDGWVVGWMDIIYCWIDR
jgi:hypothetical protein